MANYETTFSFRKRKGEVDKRPSVTVNVEVPTAQELQEYLNDPKSKEAELITDLITGAVTSHVRGFVESDYEFNQESYDALNEKGVVSFTYLANQPKSVRNVLSKEDLEDFAQSYIPVVMQATGKDQARVETAAAIMVNKFKGVNGNTNILKTLKQQLEVYVENASDEDTQQHERAINWLLQRAEDLISEVVTAEDI